MAIAFNDPPAPPDFSHGLGLPKPPAQWAYERLVHSIHDFEQSLDQEHEIGARLVNFSATMTFHIQDLGYWGPDILIFYGTNEEKKPIELHQHYSQLSVLLIAVEKAGPEPRRIGFGLIEKLDK